MNIRVLLSCALAALLLAGCVARLPAESDPFPSDDGKSSPPVPETIAVPSTDPVPETTADTAEAVTTPRHSSPVAQLTGYPNGPIHEHPQKFPDYIEWDGVLYRRLLNTYITDEDCAELEPKGSYTWWSDSTTSHKNMIRLYSVGDLPSSACVGTRFSLFEKGSLVVYVNEAEWTAEMEQEIAARLVQKN